MLNLTVKPTPKTSRHDGLDSSCGRASEVQKTASFGGDRISCSNACKFDGNTVDPMVMVLSPRHWAVPPYKKDIKWGQRGLAGLVLKKLKLKSIYLEIYPKIICR
jgi:hypothetical protein